MGSREEPRRNFTGDGSGTLDRVGPQGIKMYLIFRIRSSSGAAKRGLYRSTVNLYYRTLQMVYQLDTERQLAKSTNDIINAVCTGMFWR